MLVGGLALHHNVVCPYPGSWVSGNFSAHYWGLGIQFDVSCANPSSYFSPVYVNDGELPLWVFLLIAPPCSPFEFTTDQTQGMGQLFDA